MRRAAIAVAAAAALLGAAPAAHARTDDLAKPVLLVAGPERTSCTLYDDVAFKLGEYTVSVNGKKVGPAERIETVGRGGDCVRKLGTGGFAAMADDLADVIATKYDNKPVDVIAEGGAGLLLRYAIEHHPQLKVEDAVTIGTPHAGSSALADACGCNELQPGSAFLKALARNPQGTGGTDWSAIGSDADPIVSGESAVAMDAEHRTLYVTASRSDLLHDTSTGMDARLRHSHGLTSWINWNKAPHPVIRAIKDLVFGSGDVDLTCGLQETNPDACWKTPVILVPGFGASELSCTVGDKTTNLWPGALTDEDLFEEMALTGDGTNGWKGSECSRNVAPTGHVLKSVVKLKNIHGDSWEWLTKIAPGRAYEFGWDYRLGPDKSLERLDKYINEIRARHGVSKVAIVSHSYGGLLTRWYIDEPERAKKVARVANFGSPWWGAAKPWFAMAYGYESPGFSPTDVLLSGLAFRVFIATNAGAYYLFPSDSWFKKAPEPLRNWLEVDDTPARSLAKVADAVRAFHGNADLLNKAAAGHAEHIDGFKATNGVDFRTFIGSGLPTLGHVRAYTGSTEVQYSWINGDGTVPLFSQRQSARPGDNQLGQNIKTYNFCGIKHMGEMEDGKIQEAVTPFVRDGQEPSKANGVLKDAPCPLAESEFKVTGKEDMRSVSISTDAEAVSGIPPASASRVRARASAATTMTLQEAQGAGLVDVMYDPNQTVIVTNTHAPITVHVAGKGTVQVTPITGEGKEGAARVYDVTPAGIAISAQGAKTTSAAPSRAADRTAPRTTLKRRGGRLVAKAKDASGVAVTLVQIGNRKPKRYTKPLKAARRATVRYWSVDVWGNAERKHRLK
jgi:pimeloyl-ACP methyl ester carboxylesterase